MKICKKVRKNRKLTRDSLLKLEKINLSKENRSQQEMIGFVLIVVLVVVALMIFLVISLKNKEEVDDSIQIKNLLNSFMKYTTNCAIVYEPNYDDIRDLIKSCYNGEDCSNLNESACEYMNKTLTSIIRDSMATEADFSAYELDIFDGVSEDEKKFHLSEGNCSGDIYGALERIKISSDKKAVVRLRICD